MLIPNFAALINDMIVAPENKINNALAGIKKTVETLAKEIRDILDAYRSLPEIRRRRQSDWLKAGLTLYWRRRRVPLRLVNLASRQANARVDSVIAAMPASARVALYLASHGDGIALGPYHIRGRQDRKSGDCH